MELWYISFAGDHSFSGGVFILAESCEDAEQRCRKLDIRPPGSQFAGGPVPEHQIEDVKPEMMNRLLTLKELNEFLPHWGFERLGDKLDKGFEVDRSRVHVRD